MHWTFSIALTSCEMAPFVEGITLLELFGSISIGLAIMLEVILHVTCYIYIDSNIVTCKAT